MRRSQIGRKELTVTLLAVVTALGVATGTASAVTTLTPLPSPVERPSPGSLGTVLDIDESGDTAVTRSSAGLLIYERVGDGYELTQTLAPPTAPPNFADGNAAPRAFIRFGQRLSISGDRIVAVAQRTIPDATNPIPDGFVLFEYVRDASGTFVERSRINIEGAFGLSLDGDLLAVSRLSNPIPFVGSVAIYEFDDTSSAGPTLAAELGLPVPVPFDGFGRSISLQGGLLAVGAPSANSSRGAGYVFTQTGGPGQWSLPVMLNDPTPESRANFGAEIDTDGTHIILSTSADEAGAVVFDADGTVVQELAAPRDDFLSVATEVEIDGPRIVLGLNGLSISRLQAVQGQVVPFVADADGVYQAQPGVVVPNANSTSDLGRIMSLADDTAIISAPTTGAGRGALFQLTFP